MSEDNDPQYNNSNRAFLQAFIARSTLTYEEAKPILAAILTAHGNHPAQTSPSISPKKPLTSPTEKRETLPEDITERDFSAYITAANTAISPFDLEIRSTYHQTTRARIYALVNSTSDPITQLATTHSADEISYLKRVLDAMFETYNTPRQEVMAITSMQAVRLHKFPSGDRRETTQNGSAGQGQGVTMMQAEKMLKTLVEEGWFEKSRRGYYGLSPRALMELRGWLIETYNDFGEGDEDEDEDDERVVKVKLCFACKEIITVVSGCGRGVRHEWDNVLIDFFRLRANDVRRGAVLAVYTIYARRTSSGRKRPRSARCARRIGRGIISLAREQSPVPKVRVEASVEVVAARPVAETRRWWWRRRRPKKPGRPRILKKATQLRSPRRLRRTRTKRSSITTPCLHAVKIDICQTSQPTGIRP